MRSRLFGVFWIVVCAGLLAGCVGAEEVRRADAIRELGLSYLHEGRLEDALEQLLQARKLNPKDARIRHELGLAFFAKDLRPEAERELRAAIKLDPALTEAKLNLGTLYIAMERYEDAERYLKQATGDYLYRSPARARNNLGWVYYKQGKMDQALAEYEKALQVAPGFCQALYNASLVHAGRDRLEAALNYLERAVNSCPEDLRYRLDLGRLLARLERPEEARKNLELVVNNDASGALGAEARELMRTLK